MVGSLPEKRILVVDDDPHVRALTCRVLHDTGYETVEAAEGGAALGLVESQTPDLVLLDIDMDGIDGWGFLRHLKRVEKPPPVVFLSGSIGFDGFARGARAGVAAFMGKPIHYSRLLATCGRILSWPPTEEKPDDRRDAQRRQILVKVGLLSKLGTSHAIGELTDLSASGARVILMGPLEVGGQVRFALDEVVAGELMRFDCEVRWCAPLPDGYAHGLAFLGLSPEVKRSLAAVLGSAEDSPAIGVDDD